MHVGSRKMDWRLKNPAGTVDWEADADEFRKFIALSAVLAELLPRMPEKYLALERFRNYFAGRFYFVSIYIREAIMLLAATEVIKVTSRDSETMKRIEANGEEGQKILEARRDWILNLTQAQLDEYSEGGVGRRTRQVFRDVKQWIRENEKNGWVKVMRKMTKKEEEQGGDDG